MTTSSDRARIRPSAAGGWPEEDATMSEGNSSSGAIPSDERLIQLSRVHQACLAAANNIGFANLAAIKANTQEEGEREDIAPETDPIEQVILRIRQVALSFPLYPCPDPFIGESVVNLAGIEGSSAHAICLEMLIRCGNLINHADNGCLPTQPQRYTTLPGMLSYFEAEGDPLNYFGGKVPARDRRILMLRALFVRWAGLEVATGESHARRVNGEIEFRFKSHIDVEWNRAIEKFIAARGSRVAAPVSPKYSVSADYATVTVGATKYTFNKTQRRIIECLIVAYESGTPALCQAHIIESAGGSGKRLRDSFKPRNGETHPAWNKIIVPVRGRKDVYQFAPTE